ncbi:hypothetical protein ABZV91_09730 [Nocardia sp. NPDC004568]|uniref:hypothetical protein n=1 Tax=Nocardia sp. NPDC004568 TaxID=3154551 RepID=UPI0033A413A3
MSGAFGRPGLLPASTAPAIAGAAFRAVLESIEDVENFRLRARAWIRPVLGPYRADATAGLRGVARAELASPTTGGSSGHSTRPDSPVSRSRSDTAAGVPPPHTSGRSPAGYESLPVPGADLSPCAAVLLDFGTGEQKRRHIPAMPRARRSGRSSAPNPAAVPMPRAR